MTTRQPTTADFGAELARDRAAAARTGETDIDRAGLLMNGLMTTPAKDAIDLLALVAFQSIALSALIERLPHLGDGAEDSDMPSALAANALEVNRLLADALERMTGIPVEAFAGTSGDTH